jgi:hypothetical protein
MTTELTANHILVGNDFKDMFEKNENDYFVLIIHPSVYEKMELYMSEEYQYSGIYKIIKKSKISLTCDFHPFDFSNIKDIELFKINNIEQIISTLKFDSSQTKRIQLSINNYDLMIMYNTGELYKYNSIRIKNEFDTYTVYNNELNRINFNDVIYTNNVAIYKDHYYKYKYSNMNDNIMRFIILNKFKFQKNDTSMEVIFSMYIYLKSIIHKIDCDKSDQKDVIDYIIKMNIIFNNKLNIKINIIHQMIISYLSNDEVEHYIGYRKIVEEIKKINNLYDLTLRKKIFDILSNDFYITN